MNFLLLNNSCGNCLFRAFALCQVPFTQYPTVILYQPSEVPLAPFYKGVTESQKQQVAKQGFKPRALALGPRLCLSLRALVTLHRKGQTLFVRSLLWPQPLEYSQCTCACVRTSQALTALSGPHSAHCPALHSPCCARLTVGV